MSDCTDVVREEAVQQDHAQFAAPEASPRDGSESDVSTLLDQWQAAADALEQVHRSKCDEVARLRQALAEATIELAQRHRLADFSATVGRLAAGMKNSIQGIQQQLDLLRRRSSASEGAELLNKAAADVAAWEAAVDDLIHFSGECSPEAELLSLRELVDGARCALAPQLSHHAVHLLVDVPEEARAVGDQRLLQRAIVNVVLQALDRLPQGGEVVVAAAQGEQTLDVEVACGSDAPADQSGRTQSTAAGAAVLRWAVVRHILEQHGGEALAKANDRGGMSFVLRIPHEQDG